MRRAFLAVLAAALVASVGCHHNLAGGCRGGCNHGLAGGHGGHGGGHALGGHSGGHAGGYVGHRRRPTPVRPLPHGHEDYLSSPMAGGPPTATSAYPYYTIHAPRDFLSANPPSLGH